MTHTVKISDMVVSAGPEDEVVTHALGSCLGITVYDPAARVAGMLHVQLPTSQIDPDRARTTPHMFVDTGVPELFRAAYALGAKKERMDVKVAGGANLLDEGKSFRIGERNFAALRKLLWKNNVLIKAHDVGGRESRTLYMNVGTGAVRIRTGGATKEL
jgi:chemotaxis protein CheD